MNTTLLWRLAGADTSPLHPERLATSLRQHVQHTPITSTLMQIGEVQHAYVTLAGCAGCAEGQCEIGCYRQLFARILHATWPTTTLQLVRRGLMARPYTRTVLAWPTANAQPLDGRLLHPWSDARLVVHWRGRAGQVQSGAVLAVDADGPDPRARLAVWGWTTFMVPGRPLRARLLATGAPVFAWHQWNGDIALLAPAPRPERDEAHTLTHEDTAIADAGADALLSAPLTIHLTNANAVTDPARDSALDDDALAAWLRDTVLGATTGSTPLGSVYQRPAAPTAAEVAALTVPSEAPDGDGRWWPRGPASLPPLEVAALITRLATDSRPNAPIQASQRGLSKKRLMDWFGLSDADAKVWMVWLDAAELLQPVAHKETKWTTTRPLVTDALDTLAAQLRDTPLPELRDLPVMWGGTQ